MAAFISTPAERRATSGPPATAAAVAPISPATAGDITGATAADYPIPGAATAINCTGYNTTTAPADLGLIIELRSADCTTNTFRVAGGSTTITFRPSPKYNNISFYIELLGPYPGLGCSTSTPGGTHVVNISGSPSLNIYGAFYGPGDNMSL